jgi:ABC-type transport system involved in multi-copper enzyme maturation permease subunit
VAERRERDALAAAFRAEVFKTLRRRMTWISLGVIVVLVGLVYFGLWLRLREGPGSTPEEVLTYAAIRLGVSFENVIPYGFAVERLFATIIAIVFAGTMMGNEYDWRTVNVAVSRGVRRWHFLAAKVAVSVVFSVAVAVGGFVTALAASAILTAHFGLDWGGASAGGAWSAIASLARTVFVMLPYVVLALLVGNLWRSGGQAVGASLGVLVGEQVIIGLLSLTDGWPRAIAAALFSENVQAVLLANGNFTAGGGPFIAAAGGPPLWRATLILALWLSGLAGFMFWRFQRRDLQD